MRDSVSWLSWLWPRSSTRQPQPASPIGDRALRRRVELVPVGRAVPPSWLAEELERRLDAHCTIGEPLALRTDWFAEETGQYHASSIVDALIDHAQENGFYVNRWLLGVADVDLYADTRTFVFGEATVGGCCAVIGLTRLGAGADAARYRERVVTEAVHELGHVAGLDHCDAIRCVMRSSVNALDIDQKGPDLCRKCSTLIHLHRSEAGA